MRYVVVGAGNAGRTAVETLAAEGKGGEIVLFDTENYLPYKRTQVSKKAAEGFEYEAFAVNDESWYRDRGVTLKTGCRVSGLDIDGRTLETSDGRYGWEYLLIASGAKPNRLQESLPAEMSTVLWTKDDALRFRQAVGGRGRIAIVGNGVLGVEAAWQVRWMDREAVLIGKSQRLMAKYLDPPCSAELEEAVVNAGVELVSGKMAQDVSTEENGLVLHTGSGSVRADYVVVAAGSSPDLALVEGTPIETHRGILVDDRLRTSVPGIWSAGDCAEHPDGSVTGLWHSAEHQGRLAALSMLGKDISNDNPPYRLKCEVFGGLWFSAGPVNAPETAEFPAAADWRSGDILWRPRFNGGTLASLAASAPGGMEKTQVKEAQRLLLEKAGEEACRSVLLRV